MTETTYLTKAGLDKLKAELEDLKTVRRPAVIQRIKEATSNGDLKENSEYDDAKNEQGFVEGRIAELEQLLMTSKIVSGGNGDGAVALGSTVKVRSPGGTSTFTLVGPAEADPEDGLISNESPLGKALFGRRGGDKVVATTPRGETKYEIVSIN